LLKPGESFILIADEDPRPLRGHSKRYLTIGSLGIVSNKGQESGAFVSPINTAAELAKVTRLTGERLQERGSVSGRSQLGPNGKNFVL
jgi:uncharacterized protein (DUF2249 family)